MLEAHRNADIRAVPIKTVAQQQLTALHRIRSTWMRTRTARINMVRGLLGEFGLVLPTGARRLVPGVMGLIEDADVEIPMTVRVMFSEVCTEIRELEARIQSVERELEALARQMPEVARLRSIPGIGLLTSTAMVGVSSPEESHLQALLEPDVNLSAHPAPIVPAEGTKPTRQCGNNPG